jgi:uncharacterized protein YfiM (DUF2279 family)
LKLSALLLLLFLAFPLSECMARPDSSGFFRPADSYRPRRFAAVVTTESLMYTGTMLGLNELWYKDFPRSRFHFFNDNDEWLQMDKAGHFTTCYYLGRLGIDVMKWTGLPERKAVIWGGLTGFIFEASIEVLDGFSTQWGFSGGDMIANTAGTGLAIGQELLWKEQRIVPKFSFRETPYAAFRPNVLGKSTAESIFKDYNGQTYWLSFNLSSFAPGSRIPRWLSVAAGYGADGMTGGTENPEAVNGVKLPEFTRQRQLYLSLDIQLSRIKTKSRVLKTIFETVGFLKIPAPALEYNVGNGALKFRPLYF